MGTFGRKTHFQRVAVNQAISANGSFVMALNTGLGTKSIHLAFNALGSIILELVSCDKDGVTLTSGIVAGITSTTSGSGASRMGLIVDDWGGSPYVGLVILDKSGLANTLNYIDVWWTNDR